MNRGGKRKRGDGNDTTDGANRPSPHRPDQLDTAKRNDQSDQAQASSPRSRNNQGARGGRRTGRGGRQQSSRSAGPNSPSETPAIGPSEPIEERTPLPQKEDRPLQEAPAPEPSNPSTEKTEQLGPSVENKATRRAFHFKIITEGVLSEWQSSGLDTVRDAASTACNGNDEVALGCLYLEIIRSTLDARIEPLTGAETVKAAISVTPTGSSIDTSELFLDTVSILSEEDSTNPILKTLVLNAGIDVQTMRLVLEEPMLQSLGLVRSTFGKIFVRKQTHVLYRQANYNLLREESEGYSKLITELFRVSHNEKMPPHVVETTHQNVKALIGAFDLDAGRVLDVTLDLFATMLIKHGRFFVKFLRHSSYWPEETPNTSMVLDDMPVFGSLPTWAEPGQPNFSTSEADKERIAGLRARRDQAFWSEARERGLDAFFCLGQRPVLNKGQIAEQILEAEQAVEKASQKASASSDQVAALRALETKRWIQQTSTLPPAGNPIAAQLLGFKLRFYSSSAREKEDALPLNMVYLTALLIKIGFISLRDLYPHLYPSDEDMDAVRERQMKKKSERDQQAKPGGGTMNALAKAGALTDDTVSATTSATSRLRVPEARAGTPSKGQADAGSSTPARSEEGQEQAEQLQEPTEQKLPLLKALLLIGAIPESLYMLGKFPWLLDAYSELPSHVHRILHHCLSLVYDQVSTTFHLTDLDASAQVLAADQAAVPKGQVRLVDQPVLKKKKWAQAESSEYSFYWDDWADNVPVCRTVDDVFTLCSTLVNLVGVKIGQDATLMMKLVRIGKHSLATDKSTSNQDRWRDLLKRLICPSLSLTRSNPGVVNEVYDMLKTYPVQTRYNIYAEWFLGQTSRNPDIVTAFDFTRAETRDVMRRIHKLNTREMARSLAKASCASPGIVFDVCLKQIESYDNLIDVVVEGGRYFTYLAYDVMTWSIMSCLGREGRDLVTDTGFVATKWLQAQSTFTGRICRRYATMDSLPILQYIFNQTLQNNSADLRVLREMIFNMTGIEAEKNFTDAQVLAMSGGTILQSLTLRSIGDKRHENRPAARRLIRVLIDSKLAAPFLILIAQHRQTCVFSHKRDVNKILAETFDEITLVLMQYLDMLNTYLSPEEFERHVPHVVDLISKYGIETSLAFTIHRNGITRALRKHDTEHKPPRRTGRSSDADKTSVVDVDMKDRPDVKAAADTLSAVDDNVKAESETPAASFSGVGDPEAPHSSNKSESLVANDASSMWHPILEDIASRLQGLLPEDTDGLLDPHFSATFWQLDLSDIVAPSISYDSELKKLDLRAVRIDNDKSDMTTIGVKRKDSEKEEIRKTKDQLVQEMKTHIRDYQVVRNRLMKEKDHWFPTPSSKPGQLSLAILQECFLPRILISPLDSQFTQRMLFFLHSVGARRFQTLELLGKLFAKNTLTNLIYQCTNTEADNFGRFLYEVLKVMAEWHADQSVFEKKALGPKRDLPGFATRLDHDGTPKIFMEFEDFRRVLSTWHQNIHASLQACLKSYEYLHVRNAITVLNRIVKVFPAIVWMGTNTINALRELTEREKTDLKNPENTPIARKDLHLAVNAVLTGVILREKTWVIPQAFSMQLLDTKEADDAEPEASVQSSKSESKDDRPLAISAENDRTAKPASHGITDPPLSAARSEMEEGEFRDVLMPDANVPPTKMPTPPTAGTTHANEMTSTAAQPGSGLSESNAPEKPETDKSTQRLQTSLPKERPEEKRSEERAVETAQDPVVSDAHVPSKPLVNPSPVQRHPVNREHIPPKHPATALATSRRNEPLELAPNGPRNGRRQPSSSYQENARYQDNMGPPPAPRGAADRPMDRNHVESARPSRHQDISYGRLNAEPDSFQNPPSGTSRGGRQSNGPPFTDRQAGPSVHPIITDRANAHSSAELQRPARNQDQRSARLPSNPVSPVVESPTNPEGVHPSRLRHISGDNAPHPSSRPMGVPPTNQGRMSQPEAYPSSSNPPPSGPRSNQPPSTEYANNPSGSSSSFNNGRGPPTGPSHAPHGVNVNRHDGRRQLAGLNDTLRQGAAAMPSNNNVSGQRASSAQNSALPPRLPSGVNERPGSQQENRNPSFRSQDPNHLNHANNGQLPNKPPARVPPRPSSAHGATVDPRRAALIEELNGPDTRGQVYSRNEQRNNATQQPMQPNAERSDAHRVLSGPGAAIRGRSGMSNADVRYAGPQAASHPNGSVPARPPPTQNAMQYDRRNEAANQAPVQTRSHRDPHNEPRDGDRTRRDDQHRGRGERGSDRLMHNGNDNSGRHQQPSRDASREKRIEGDRDRIMRTREKDFASRSSRPDDHETMRRGEEQRNPRETKELMPGVMPQYRERDRLSGGRPRDDRGGSNREDLMGPRGERGAPPQRAAGPSNEYGAPEPYNTKERRVEPSNENRGDSRGNSRGGDGRGDNRRGDFGRDRMNGGGSERMKREWNGDDGSRDNKRPRRGNQ